MDTVGKLLLLVIAAALCGITVKLYGGAGPLQCGPTYGDFISLKDIEDLQKRDHVRVKLIQGMPMVRIQGGKIDADVTGTVSVER